MSECCVSTSRQDSSATFPSNVTVKKGDYKSPEFLESALQRSGRAHPHLRRDDSPRCSIRLINAAAKAGVPWILPNEYGQDGANPDLAKVVGVLCMNERYRNEIEELGVSSWIGIASSLWFDFSLKGGFYGIDIAARKAEIYDDGSTSIVATTVPQVGRAVARLLSLPLQSSSPCLSDYKNKFVYITSFSVTQNHMLAAAQHATGTTPADWTVTHKPVDQWMQEGREMLAKGERRGLLNVLYGATFKKGLGDQFHGREVANEKLGLKEEDLDEVVQRIVKEVEAK